MIKIGKHFSPSAMEPLLPAENRYPELINLATELIAQSSALTARLHPKVAESVGNLVRNMNCYYSNLIEGHNTHPRDIDRALENILSHDTKKRALQLEAKAHIEVQRLIDYGKIEFTISTDFIKRLHYEFCQRLPEEFLWIKNPDTEKQVAVKPGQLRIDWVQVGRHVPPDPEDIEKFLLRFAEGYNLAHLTKIKQVTAVAASHHRLLWIHPFLDGNGRVARLFSHAFLRHLGIGSSLWSVARGLARKAEEYKAELMEADSVRQGDLDGRGNLSERGLASFCNFFLTACLDQIQYMNSLVEPTELYRRIELYVEEEQKRGYLAKGSLSLLKEALYTGEFERGKAPAVTGYQERQARTVLNKLVDAKLLLSDTPKGLVRLNFPIDVIERWFPKLYPVT